MSTNFASLGVPDRLLSRLETQGIDTPTSIQAEAIPIILQGRDLVAQAPTGSGKTLAFGLPMVMNLTGARGADRRPRGLVMTPTRELALQVQRSMVALAPRNFWVLPVYGGTPYGSQIRQLAKGVDVVVATPGRLIDLFERKALDLSAITQVVVDEVDRMADMGFGPVIEQILSLLPARQASSLFSATVDQAVSHLAAKFLADPARVTIEADAPKLEHRFIKVDRREKPSAVSELALDYGSTIVFCNTREQVDRLEERLENLGVDSVTVHGGLSQRQREAAIRRFHSHRASILVATDVAARGIHIDQVALVIHYDLPSSFTDYLHRSGRTGRAGNTGVVASLVSDYDAAKARAIESELRGEVAERGAGMRGNRRRSEKSRRFGASSSRRSGHPAGRGSSKRRLAS